MKGCELRHHTLLHEIPRATASTASARTQKPQVALGVIHAEALDHHGNAIPINILFDECSTDAFLRSRLAHRLYRTGVAQILNID